MEVTTEGECRVSKCLKRHLTRVRFLALALAPTLFLAHLATSSWLPGFEILSPIKESVDALYISIITREMQALVASGRDPTVTGKGMRGDRFVSAPTVNEHQVTQRRRTTTQ